MWNFCRPILPCKAYLSITTAQKLGTDQLCIDLSFWQPSFSSHLQSVLQQQHQSIWDSTLSQILQITIKGKGNTKFLSPVISQNFLYYLFLVKKINYNWSMPLVLYSYPLDWFSPPSSLPIFCQWHSCWPSLITHYRLAH